MRGEKKYKQAVQIIENLYNIKQINYLKKIDMYNNYLRLIRSSAYAGNPKAQFELALHYEEYNFFGKNKYYNKNKTLYWYKKSCASNCADACNSLATLFESNNSISDAIKFYEKAIQFGNNMAKKNLIKLKKQQGL